MSQQSDSFPRLADHRTPFIMNEWYVAALSSEVGRELMARTFLGRSVLLYRTMAGNVVAMRNRCPHRSFPLSKSRLEGDTVVCGYHGLHFGSDGKCIAVPSQDNVPEGLATASYPIVEKTPLVWIWMGDPTAADPATIPAHDYLSDPGFATVHGYMHSQSNYLRMHENVLDLTHFAYLHEGVGDLEYVQVPPKVEVKGNSVRITRTLADRPVLPAFGGFIGNLGHRVNRTSDSWFVSPAYHVSHSLIEDLEGGVNGKTMFHNKVVHCTTPETPHSCHYFFLNARDVRLDDEPLSARLIEMFRDTFLQDEDALHEVEKFWMHDDDSDYSEFSVLADRAGLHMRSIVARRAAAEYANRNHRQAAAEPQAAE